MSGLSHGGCGSSSLRECIELLNNTIRKASAALHSGIENEESPDPPHVRVKMGQITHTSGEM